MGHQRHNYSVTLSNTKLKYDTVEQTVIFGTQLEATLQYFPSKTNAPIIIVIYKSIL